jgi:hypothetical protein
MSRRAAARIVLLAGALLLGAGTWATPARANTWCGGTPGARDTLPDAVGGNQFHVIYAIPADGVDHFTERVSGIARATFRLAVTIRGRGHVTSVPAGLIACPRRCSSKPVSGTTVELRARPAAKFRFVGWRGDCTGRALCNVTDEAHVTAVFGRRP